MEKNLKLFPAMYERTMRDKEEQKVQIRGGTH